MDLEEMKKRKKELGYTNAMLAEMSGIPLSTVQKIFSGETSSPRYYTVQAITKILENDRRPGSGESDSCLGEGCFDDICEVHETETAYDISGSIGAESSGRSRISDLGYGSKTIDDYIALPEGTRVELINGRFYDMAAPTTIHQAIAAEIYRILKNHVEKKSGKCMPFIAPTDVQLDCDNKTMVQPDVLIICDRKKITKARIVGAPDFIVEIVSPSNAITDVLIKMVKYRDAGVREYWIVFPEEKMIMVYHFEKSGEPKTFTFDDKVPVGIWNSECEIDFRYIFSQIDFMYDR